MKYTHDLIVVGAGSGGLTAAESAAHLGAKVLLIEERERLGGECLHYGCIPSKALIAVARDVHTAYHKVSKYGVSASGAVSMSAIRDQLRSAISDIEHVHDNDDYYHSLGVEVVHGAANFTSRHDLKIGTKTYSAPRIIIASGSTPRIPAIPGLAETPYLTNETIFDLEVVPERLTVIGGGPIGCELGQAFAMLGSRVTILHSADRLLPRDEPEASKALLESMWSIGIDVKFNVNIKGATFSENNIIIDTVDGAIRSSHLLVATGRSPRVPHNSDSVGIEVNNDGSVRTNEKLQTSVSHIYAVGDCRGVPNFTHSAVEQAGIAVRNALFIPSKKYDPSMTPAVTYTSPEIAHIGMPLDELQKGLGVVLHRKVIDYKELDRMVAERENGTVVLYTNSADTLLGASVWGAGAGAIVNILQPYIMARAKAHELTNVVQPYPSAGTSVQQLGSGYSFVAIEKYRWLVKLLRLFR